MKVLNIDVTVDPVSGGGCAERTFQMTRALDRNNVDCRLLVLDIGLTEERLMALGNVDVTVFPCLNQRFYVPLPRLWQLADLVRGADIIHLMGHWEFTDALVYPFLRWFQKPYVNCPAGSLNIYGRSKGLKWIHDRLIGRQIVRNAEKLIAISPNEFYQFRQYGAKSSNIALIPNGINPEEYILADDRSFRTRYELGDNPFILFIGRLNPIKGPDLLLRAFVEIESAYPDHHLVFAGPDEGLQKDLQRQAVESGMQNRVHFTGFLAQKEKSMALHAAEFLVIPSRSEAMSIVVLEAGAASTPVLATDQCGLNDIADIGGGAIVPVSVEGLNKGLRKMISSGSELIAMGKKLNKFVLADYTWQAMAERLVELYRDILARQ